MIIVEDSIFFNERLIVFINFEDKNILIICEKKTILM